MPKMKVYVTFAWDQGTKRRDNVQGIFHSYHDARACAHDCIDDKYDFTDVVEYEVE